jgi:hypothetical protein
VENKNNLFNGKANSLTESDLVQIASENPFILCYIPKAQRTKAVLSAACRQNPLAIHGTKAEERNEKVNAQLASNNADVIFAFEKEELTVSVVEAAIKNKPTIAGCFGRTLPINKLTKELYLLACELSPLFAVREKHLYGVFDVNIQEILACALRREPGLCVYLSQCQFETIENHAGSPD